MPPEGVGAVIHNVQHEVSIGKPKAVLGREQWPGRDRKDKAW